MEINIEEAKYILCAFENQENQDGFLNSVEQNICNRIKEEFNL